MGIFLLFFLHEEESFTIGGRAAGLMLVTSGSL